MWKFPYYEVDKEVDWELLLDKFDWLRDMIGVEQDKIWHREGDVYTHTKMVVDALISLPEYHNLDEQSKHILIASALLHDVEKRSTTKIEIIADKSRVVSPRHAKYGESTVRGLFYREYGTPFFIREHITKLVRYHGLPLFLLESKNPTKEAIRASLVLDTSLLYLLAKADVLGRYCEDRDEILLNIELFKEICIESNCFGQKRDFSSNYGRFLYLNRDDILVDYKPYDDLEFSVTLMCAVPASGKDYYIRENLSDLPILSLDDIRREHKIKPTDKKGNGRVVQMAKEQAKVYMREKKSFVFNATNITKDMRSRWISLFLDYRARVKIIYLEVPYKRLKEQNKNREYPVPINIIDKLIDKLEIPSLDEAHEVEFCLFK